MRVRIRVIGGHEAYTARHARNMLDLHARLVRVRVRVRLKLG